MTIRVSACAVIVRHGAILLVEYNDSASGIHYNLPGGGVEPGESLHQAVRREVREETGAEVGSLLLVWEYVPETQEYRYGTQHKLALCFRCELRLGSEPHLPEKPDADQTGVRWIPLADLPNVPLIPRVTDRLLAAIATPFADVPDLLYRGDL